MRVANIESFCKDLTIKGRSDRYRAEGNKTLKGGLSERSTWEVGLSGKK